MHELTANEARSDELNITEILVNTRVAVIWKHFHENHGIPSSLQIMLISSFRLQPETYPSLLTWMTDGGGRGVIEFRRQK